MKTFIVAAISVDGFIAADIAQSTDWTSKEDKKLFVELTRRAGVMIMGNNTFKTIGRALPDRKTIVYSRTIPEMIPENVEFTSEDPSMLLKQLEIKGYNEVAICGGQSIYDIFLQAGAVDELYITVEPTIFGAGISLFKTAALHDLTLKECTNLNTNAVLLHYEVQK